MANRRKQNSRAARPLATEVAASRNTIVEKKKEEFEDYAQQIAALAHSYAHADPQRLQQAYQQGNVTAGICRCTRRI